MFQAQYLALFAFAAACTFAWLYLERRVLISGMTAAAGWLTLALVGADVETVSSGEVVTAAVPDPLRWLFAVLGVLSVLAVILYTAGAYPPRDHEL